MPYPEEVEQPDFSEPEDQVVEETEVGGEASAAEPESTETAVPEKITFQEELTREQYDEMRRKAQERDQLVAEAERKRQREEWERNQPPPDQFAREYRKIKQDIRRAAAIPEDQRQPDDPDPIDLIIGTAVNIVEARIASNVNRASSAEQQYQSFRYNVFDADPDMADFRGQDWAAREAYRHYQEGRLPKRAVIGLLRELQGEVKPRPAKPTPSPQPTQSDEERRRRIQLAPAATGVRSNREKDAATAGRTAFEKQYLGL